MTELAFDGQNPDLGLLYNINDLARYAPGWLDRAVVFTGQYALVGAVALLALWCWWVPARRQGPAAVAGVVWSAVAAVFAVLLAVPIRSLVERPRPWVDNENLDVLARGGHLYSFVDARATVTMAVGVGLFMVGRRVGLVGIALAMLEGFCRVFMGVDYPTDVVGGFALGTATALLLAPAATALLVPAAEAAGRSRVAFLVRSARRVPSAVRGEPYPEPTAHDKDLAA